MIVIVIVTGVDIVGAQVAMTMGIVGLLDARHTEVVIIHHPMVVEGREGTGPGHLFVHLMLVQTESMFEVLGEPVIIFPLKEVRTLWIMVVSCGLLEADSLGLN